MAYFVRLTNGNTEFFINLDNVNYIQSSGEKCAIYFGKDHCISVNDSAYAVIGKAQDGTKIPG
jgi:hypothetical protein